MESMQMLLDGGFDEDVFTRDSNSWFNPQKNAPTQLSEESGGFCYVN